MIISKRSKLDYDPNATDEQINKTWIRIRDMALARSDISNFHITTNKTQHCFELVYEQRVNWVVGQCLVLWSWLKHG